MANEQKETHPLVAKEIIRIHNYSEWLLRWTTATSQEELIGLLHKVFSYARNTQWDRYDEVNTENVQMCLRIADGYKYSSHFRSAQSDTEVSRIERQEIAKVALRMLCRYFFGGQKKNGLPPWMKLIIQPPVFEAVLGFFTTEECRNLPDYLPTDNFENGVLMEFLPQAIKFVWEFQGAYHQNERLLSDKDGERMKAMFLVARPQLLDLMFEMRLLHLLIPRSRYRTQMAMDEPSMEKLEELALIKDKRHGKIELYPSVPFAAAAGSQAAQTLLLLRIIQGENERQVKIEKLKELQQTLTEELHAFQMPDTNQPSAI